MTTEPRNSYEEIREARRERVARARTELADAERALAEMEPLMPGHPEPGLAYGGWFGQVHRMGPTVNVGPFATLAQAQQWSIRTGVRLSLHVMVDPDGNSFEPGADVWL